MRKTACIVAALLLGSGPAQAGNTPKRAAMPQHAATPAALVKIGLVETARPQLHDQVTRCANLAAMRTLDAKAAGAGYAAQDRILDLSFLLCMSGPPTAD